MNGIDCTLDPGSEVEVVVEINKWSINTQSCAD